MGRGASGKSTLARRLGDITGLPVIEVDKIFWQPGLIATPRDQWHPVRCSTYFAGLRQSVGFSRTQPALREAPGKRYLSGDCVS